MSRCTDDSPPPASEAQLLCNTVTATNVYGFHTIMRIFSLIYCVSQGHIKCNCRGREEFIVVRFVLYYIAVSSIG